MPRKKRISRVNYLHHVMFRGVNGENVFYDDHDRIRFCLLLQEGCEKHSILVHGFCLMSNHIHLVLEPIKDSLQSGIHAFAFRYAQYFNRRHKRRGYLFQGRFKSILVEDGAYLKRLIRYIHLNPIEAKIVSRPEQYKWCSFRAYLGQEHYVWLQTDRVLSKFGKTREEAIKSLVTHTHQKIEAELDIKVISQAYRKGVFGSEELLTTIGKVDNKNNMVINIRASTSTLELLDMVEYICQYFNITRNELSGQSKNKKHVDARSALALISRRTSLWSLENVSAILGKNSGTISRLATRAEQQPELLYKVSNMESHLFGQETH